jgi:putative oxidoreductase
MLDLKSWSPRVLSLLRVIFALLYLEHGLILVAQFPGIEPGAHHPVKPLVLAGGYLATVTGGLMTLGLFTRICAFLASGHLAVAYFMTHAHAGFYPALNGGEPAVALCFVFFYLAFAGGGPLSLDAVLRKNRL